VGECWVKMRCDHCIYVHILTIIIFGEVWCNAIGLVSYPDPRRGRYGVYTVDGKLLRAGLAEGLGKLGGSVFY